MDQAITSALILLVLLQVKHMFADFFMQTPRMLAGRDEYFHIGRMQHVALHGVFSVVVFFVIGAPIFFNLVICAIETVVHYHIDWLKGWYSASKAHGPTDPSYWRAFGADQFMHQLTYVVMVWAWVAFGM